jgi:hypothetical protein
VVQAREGQTVYAKIDDKWTGIGEFGGTEWAFADGALTKCYGWYKCKSFAISPFLNIDIVCGVAVMSLVRNIRGHRPLGRGKKGQKRDLVWRLAKTEHIKFYNAC